MSAYNKGDDMATNIFIEPTLLVGLGTTGSRIVAETRRQMRAAYGDLPTLAFLSIDVDDSTDPAIVPHFDPSERIALVGFNADEVLANLPRFPAISAWWPTATRLKPGQVRYGAGQVRLTGRLALFRKFNDRSAGPALIDKLRGACARLRQINLHAAAEQMSDDRYRFHVERGARVILVSSTCGGSGSALMWDIAYLCRQALGDDAHTITAVAVLPPVIDSALRHETQAQRDRIRANTYAWFREHQLLLSHPVWRVRYPEGAPTEIAMPPFDRTFLVDIANQAGDRLATAEDVYRMVASALFLTTGSSVAGAIRSFDANVSVLGEQFQGRPRAYSALATASLIYPAGRILAYCSARLGFDMIRRGLMAHPAPADVDAEAAALISRLRLAPHDLVSDLLAEHRLPAPLKRLSAATSIESTRQLIPTQEAIDADALQLAEQRMEAAVAAQVSSQARKLSDSIHQLLRERGPFFASELIRTLLAVPPIDRPVPEDSAALAGLRRLLPQPGEVSERLASVDSALAAERATLVQPGRSIGSVLGKLAPASYRRSIEGARESWLRKRETRYALALQQTVRRSAAAVYDQLAEHIQSLQLVVGQAAQAIRGAGTLLREAADIALADAPRADSFQLQIEVVDTAYITAFYERQSASIDARELYQSVARSIDVRPDQPSEIWESATLARLLRAQAEVPFAKHIERTSLLHALEAHYGDKAHQVIAALFTRAVRYCHPFWQYAGNSGIAGYEGRSIIGLYDAESPLVPTAYHDNALFELKSTGFLHRIDVVRVQHGMPAFLLRNMADYQAAYQWRRAAGDSLHILPGADEAEDLFPALPQHGDDLFALASIFKLVVQVGSWYYIRLTGDDLADGQLPHDARRLAQDRSQAAEALLRHDDLHVALERQIEAALVQLGPDGAQELLGKQIAAARREAAHAAPEDGLRLQLEREIRALELKRRQLRSGHLARAAD
jgi:hypothetical protein